MFWKSVLSQVTRLSQQTSLSSLCQNHIHPSRPHSNPTSLYDQTMTHCHLLYLIFCSIYKSCHKISHLLKICYIKIIMFVLHYTWNVFTVASFGLCNYVEKVLVLLHPFHRSESENIRDFYEVMYLRGNFSDFRHVHWPFWMFHVAYACLHCLLHL